VQRSSSSGNRRRAAKERAQPTKLDLFRSCSDVEAAAVDLEADIPPVLDDDAVESFVEQGAAVGQLMWRRDLKPLVVIGSWSQASWR
jgi:hypothetical protein